MGKHIMQKLSAVRDNHGYLTVVAILFATLITFCLIIKSNSFYQQHGNVNQLIRTYKSHK